MNVMPFYRKLCEICWFHFCSILMSFLIILQILNFFQHIPWMSFSSSYDCICSLHSHNYTCSHHIWQPFSVVVTPPPLISSWFSFLPHLFSAVSSSFSPGCCHSSPYSGCDSSCSSFSPGYHSYSASSCSCCSSPSWCSCYNLDWYSLYSKVSSYYFHRCCYSATFCDGPCRSSLWGSNLFLHNQTYILFFRQLVGPAHNNP